ncbi:MAG: prolipoprotein diacylglyceryl transferase [Verrucomicrobia bacterium]|nr:prolipoprotein diacylglyceryl transferase [Verrucomicrobiota bacterium]
MLLAGIALSLVFWVRLARRDRRLLWIWLAALLGAFVGAKAVYLLSEGWRDWGHPDTWQRLAAGKSVLGALLGGYAAVELAKKQVGYPDATGDRFALVVPLSLILGRLGCWLNGCCLGRACDSRHWWTLQDAQGVPRWPAVPVELGFNVVALLVLAFLRRQGRFPGNLFHLYLIAYGLFRFAHEWVRDTPRLLGPFSGYALAALAVAALGAMGFWQRRKAEGACE